MKKIAIFWDKRFENNNFYNLDIDKNLKPLLDLVNINWVDNTISSNLLDSRKDKDNFTILCFLTISVFSIKDYIKLFIKFPKNKKILYLWEPKVVAYLSYLKIFHLFFDKIYTWDDNLVNNKKYFKFIYYQSNHNILNQKDFNQKKFLTLINWNKASFVKDELYSQREKAIRYFEENNIEFDLYWTNWDKKNLKQKIFWFKKFISYRWKIDDKIEVLSSYKFNICFENQKNTPWYITEKIWDSFKAKSVPIYWWASNIEKYIPKNCFIDFREFDWDYEKLVIFLKSIKEVEYNKYIENINIFLNSKEAQKWFNETWARDFLNNI